VERNTEGLRDPLLGHERIAVLGLGSSGLAAAELLSLFGKTVIASDTRADLDVEAQRQKWAPSSQLVLGRNTLDGVTVAVVSPGIVPDSPIFAEAKERGIEVISELELAARATTLPIIAVTGTDGKTTTTTLIGHFLTASGLNPHMGGNIGTPLCQVVLERRSGWLVVEVSAFQLLHSPKFAPQVTVATNIAQDHMDYFSGDWASYVEAKRRPLRQMREGVAVLNLEDLEIASWSEGFGGEVTWYGKGADSQSTSGSWDENGDVVLRWGTTTKRLEASSISLLGYHNRLNIMAAGLGALACGAAPGALESVRDYQAPAHRLQVVGTFEGVEYIDDSKATNPHAAQAALQTLSAPLILIAGGVDKGLSLEAWIDDMKGHVSALVLIGALSERLAREARARALTAPIHFAGSMEDAVRLSQELALSGETRCVLLSPGCSSFDMFASYSARGDEFQRAVRAL